MADPLQHFEGSANRPPAVNDAVVERAARAVHEEGTYWPEAFVKPPWTELGRGAEEARSVARAALDGAGYPDLVATLRQVYELVADAHEKVAQAYRDEEHDDSPGNMAYALLTGALAHLDRMDHLEGGA